MFEENLLGSPFAPLEVKTLDGRRFEVQRREFAFLTTSELLIGIDIEDEVPWSFKLVRLDLVESIDLLQPDKDE